MISNVSAGKLRDQIKLLKPSKTLNTSGSHIVTYTNVGTVWCNLNTILMRYRPGITQDGCVELPNKCRYRVVSINTDTSAGMMILGVELDNTIIQTVES